MQDARSSTSARISPFDRRHAAYRPPYRLSIDIIRHAAGNTLKIRVLRASVTIILRVKFELPSNVLSSGVWRWRLNTLPR